MITCRKHAGSTCKNPGQGYKHTGNETQIGKPGNARPTKWPLDGRDPGDTLVQQGIEPQPGPGGEYIRIITRNIRGIYSHLANVVRTGADVICLQEVDLPEADRADFTAQARVAGYNIYFGEAVPLTKDAAGTFGRRTAIMVKVDIITEDATDPLDRHTNALKKSGRWVERKVPVQGTGKHIMISTFYGIPGASKEGSQRNENETYLASMCCRIRQCKDIPYFANGDYNVDPLESAVLQAHIHSGIISDVIADKANGAPKPTFKRAGVHENMGGTGVTRIDACFTNKAAANMINDILYNYTEGRTFDHVPIHIILDQARFFDTILAAEQPAKLQVRTLKHCTQSQRNTIKANEARQYSDIWATYDGQFKEAIASNNVNLAHSIWCYAAEKFLWVLQGETEDLPSNRTRRGQVMPLKEIDIANKMNACTRSARNHFSKHVERVIGVASDLKGRILRLTQGNVQQEFNIEYRPRDTQTYDTATAGKTSWRLTKHARKLWNMMTRMTEGKYETAYTSVPEEDDDEDSDDDLPPLYPADSDDEEEEPLKAPPEWRHLKIDKGNDQNKTHYGSTTVERLQGLISAIKKKARSVASLLRREIRSELEVKINAPTREADKRMFEHLRKDWIPAASAMYDPATGQHVFAQKQQHELMIREWCKVFNMHKAAPPIWEKFKEIFGEFEKHHAGAPQGVPTGKQLHARAQKAKEETAPGSDGWKPVELKALHEEAWEHRAILLALCARCGQFPDAYGEVNMAALKKKENSLTPLDHRLLTLFTCLYRIEAGAWFDLLMPWVRTVLHEKVVGAVEGYEALDVAWDAQAFLEYAMMNEQSKVLVSYDFKKYFDAFDYEWTRNFLLHIGMPAELVELQYNFYKTITRRIKKGRSHSEQFEAYNGYGQGDVLSLIPALLYVSWQFKMTDKEFPRVTKGAYLDDRNYRGDLQDILKLDKVINEFDHLAGHATQNDKTVYLMTDREERQRFMRTTVNGKQPKCPLHSEMLGYVMTVSKQKCCTYTDKRMKKSGSVSARANSAPLSFGKRKKLLATKIIPTGIHGTLWSPPSIAEAMTQRTKTLECQWGKTSKVRCPEVVIGILNEPTRANLYYAAVHRAFNETRRMLIKDTIRYHQFYEDTLWYQKWKARMDKRTQDKADNDEREYGTGPVKGFMTYAADMGMKVTLANYTIIITTQDGTRVDLCTPLAGLFNMVIKDACRYHVLDKLSKRITTEAKVMSNGKTKKPRADMQGITARVDHVTTMAMLNHKNCANPKSLQEDKDFPNNESGKDLCKPCELSGRSYRRLQTIIAGSIRPPNRMIYTGRVSTSTCTHPSCNNAIHNATHMFWECAKWTGIREKYKRQIDFMIKKLNDIPDHRGKERAKKIKHILTLPMFQQCGICPGENDAFLAAQSITSHNPHTRRIQSEDMFHGDDNGERVCLNDRQYYKVYTDGSCLNGERKELARAGWGVWFANGSEYNVHYPLEGPVQSSFRAELKAILHVLRTSVVPTIIMCDCKSVVNTFNDYCNGTKFDTNKVKDGDLWQSVFEMVDDLPTGFIQAQWMPSHMAEEDNVEKRKKAIDSGLVNENDIKYNDAADALARKGAEEHQNIDKLVNAAHDRKKLTIIVQKMLLSIWEAHIRDVAEQDTTRQAEQADLEAMEAMMQNIEAVAQFDTSTYEPWDFEQQMRTENLQETTPEQPTATEQDEDIKSKFPIYTWEHHQDNIEDVQIRVKDTVANEKFSKSTVRNLKEPPKKDKMGNIVQGRTYKKFYIPPTWWEPITWWLQQAEWSQFGIGNQVYGNDSCRMTWLEAMLLFQVQTGFKYPTTDLDLNSMERIFRDMSLRILKSAQIRFNGKKAKMEDVFHPGSGITSLKNITGFARAGICRRVKATTLEWERVLAICLEARKTDCTKQGLGVHFQCPNIGNIKRKWTPSALLEAYDAINPQVSELGSTNGPSPAAEKRRIEEISRVCFFGHRTTSARRDGKAIWHTMQAPSFWPGIVISGSTLCSQCYQIGDRAWRRNKIPRLPDRVDEGIQEGIPTPGTTEADCEQIMYRRTQKTDSEFESKRRKLQSTPRSIPTCNQKVNDNHSGDKENKKKASAEARYGLHKARVQDDYYSGRGCAILLSISDEVLDMIMPRQCSSRTRSPTPLHGQTRKSSPNDSTGNAEENTYPEFKEEKKEERTFPSTKAGRAFPAERQEGRAFPSENKKKAGRAFPAERQEGRAFPSEEKKKAGRAFPAERQEGRAFPSEDKKQAGRAFPAERQEGRAFPSEDKDKNFRKNRCSTSVSVAPMKLCLKSNYKRICRHSGVNKFSVNNTYQAPARRIEVSKNENLCANSVSGSRCRKSSHEKDTKTDTTSPRKRVRYNETNVELVADDRHHNIGIDANAACSRKGGDDMSPKQIINENIDVPEVDLITSSLSHVPSSVISQPRNIDINLKRDQISRITDSPVANNSDELPYKRVKLRTKDAVTFAVHRSNSSNIESEEANLSRALAQDAPT